MSFEKLTVPERHEPLDPPRDAETFFSLWGEKCGFTIEEVNNLFDDSKANSPLDEFHNFEHHTDTLWTGMKILDEYEAAGIHVEVDRKTIAVALMLHDVVDESVSEAAKSSKYYIPEQQGAAFLISNHRRYGLTGEQAIDGADLILATAADADIDSDAKEIVVMSDLSNVGNREDTIFNARTLLLKAELLKKRIFTKVEEFNSDSVVRLSKYYVKLWQRQNVVSVKLKEDWLINARKNIRNTLLAAAELAGKDPDSYAASLGSADVLKFLEICGQNPDKN